jgi:hypothetical protein
MKFLLAGACIIKFHQRRAPSGSGDAENAERRKRRKIKNLA